MNMWWACSGSTSSIRYKPAIVLKRPCYSEKECYTEKECYSEKEWYTKKWNMVVSAKQVKFHFLLWSPGRQASEIHGIWGTGTPCQMQQDVGLRGERAILFLHLHVMLDVSCRTSKAHAGLVAV